MVADSEIFGALLAVGASSDIAARRIPNVLPSSIAAAGVVHAASEGGLSAVLGSAAVGVLVAAVLLVSWRLRFLGGGDVKLAAACAIWLGPARLVWFLAATGIAGGALSVASLILCSAVNRAAARTRIASFVARPSTALRLSGATIPYGAAIALGALFAVQR